MDSPPRRVTRSQSRERETSSLRDAGRSSKSRMWTQSKGPMTGQSLEVVTEESPRKSPYKSPRKSTTSRFVPESPPEDAGNITGTTIRVSEPESELDPQMMLYTLPDLESYATAVLDFVLPAAKTGSVAELAKKLADSKSLQHLQFRRRVSKLAGETQNFSHAPYIDVAHVHRLFYGLFETNGLATEWSADAILHKANCAHLARELLFASDWAPFRRAIANVRDWFPSAFMNDIAHEDASQGRTVGESALAAETFQLALEIRTQALIMHIEDGQHYEAFNPVDALDDSFFLERPADGESSADAPLRGFDLDGLGGVDAPLPARFREAALERYADVRELLVENEEYVLRVLKSVYRWQKFILSAVGWISKRSEEIDEDMRKQQSTEAFHAEFFASKDSFDERMGGAAGLAAETSIQGTPTRAEPALAEPPVPAESRPEAVPESEPEPEPEPEPAQQQSKERRKSGKSSWNNAPTIARLLKRQKEARASIGPSIHREKQPASEEPRRASAPISQAPATPARAARRAIHASPASPTLVQDEQDLLHLDDSHLEIPDTTQHSLEQSQSPPMTTRTTSTLAITASDADIWARAKATPPPERGRNHTRAAAFIDRQPNAERVSSISQDSSVERRRDPAPPTPARKRRRADSDDDFEQYERAVNLRRKRREKPDQSRHKRARREHSDSDSYTPSRQLKEDIAAMSATPATQPSPPRPPSPRVEVTRPPPSSMPPSSSMVTTTDRKRWTEEEDNRLIRLIGLFGVGWARIEGENRLLDEEEDERRIEGRNQVQLKDRARNLRLKFHREGQPLPRNFEKVTMGKADYEKLRRKGIIVPER